MVKIALLSDTHGHFDQKMSQFIELADEIWHGGDIGDILYWDKFSKSKKVRAVYGNIDNHIIRTTYPKTQIFTIDGFKVIMTHIGGYPKRYAPGIRQLLIEEKPSLFISGHSHILKVIYDKELNLLHINPGAAGIQGFHRVRTMIRFSIASNHIKDLEIWEHKR